MLNLRAIVGIAAACALLALTGCAVKPQLAVPMSASALSTKDTRIGVAMTPLPKPDTYFPGAGCLLCMAAASAANSSLTSHAATLSAAELQKLKPTLADLISKRGATPVVIAEDINLEAFPKRDAAQMNFARTDLSALRTKYNIDKLVLINVSVVGFERSYSSYFPTSDPKASLDGGAGLIDLKTHAYEWYQPLVVRRASDGPWDEPPKYPGLSNSYYQVLEMAADQVVKPFKL